MESTPHVFRWIFSDATHQLLVSHTIQISIVALCCVFAARIFKRYSYFCYLLLFLGIVKCLIPPVVPGPLGFFTPFDSSVVQFSPVDQTPLPVDQAPLIEIEDRPLVGDPSLSTGQADSLWPNNNPVSDSQTGVEQGPERDLTTEPLPANAVSLRPTFFTLQNVGRLMIPGLIVLGLIGGCVLFIRYLSQLKQLRATINHKLSKRWQPRLDQLVNQLGLSQVRLWISDQAFTPSAFGILRPTVVIPARLLKRADHREIEMVMLHELMHIRRRDSLFAVFQTIAVCIWWFNPLVWILSRNLSRQRELCCDLDTVWYGKLDRSAYGHCLLNVMQQIPRTQKQIGFGISPFFQVKQRLENIMALRKERNRLSQLLSTSTLLIVAALLLSGASFPMNNDTRVTGSNDTTDEFKLYFETDNAIVEYLPRPYDQPADRSKLKTVFQKKQQMSRPAISPDGSKLAFSSYQNNLRRLWVADLDGNAVAISPENGRDSIDQIQWSPDGSQIAYRTRGTQTSALYLVNPDGSNHRKLRSYQGEYSPGLSMYDEFCWSPDGDALAVAKVIEVNINIFGSMEQVTRNSVLVIHHLDRKGDEQRVEKHELGERQMISNVAWSPDGQWLAFMSDRKLKLISVEGNEEEKVLFSDLAPGAEPIWSHDSKSILVHRAAAASPQPPGAVLLKKTYAFCIVPIEGEAKQIPIDFDVWNYAWDDQNETILSTGLGHRLYQVKHDGAVNVLAEGTGFWSKVQLNPVFLQERKQQDPQELQRGVQPPPARVDAPPILRPDQMEFAEEKATTNDEGLPAITYPPSRAGKRWAETVDGGARVSINGGIEFEEIEYHLSLAWTLLAIKEGKTIWSHHVSAFWNHLEVTELTLDDNTKKKVLALRNKRRDDLKDYVEYYDLTSGEKIELENQSSKPSGEEIEIARSWHGGDAINEEPLFKVVTTAEDWASFREKVFEEDCDIPLDAFNPEKEVLVVIASGKSTNCGGISPAAAYESDETLTVRLTRHTYQTDGNGQTEYPYGVFVLPKLLDKEYVFQRNHQGFIGGPEIWKTFNKFRFVK